MPFIGGGEGGEGGGVRIKNVMSLINCVPTIELEV